jgi:hypothetical protein
MPVVVVDAGAVATRSVWGGVVVVSPLLPSHVRPARVLAPDRLLVVVLKMVQALCVSTVQPVLVCRKRYRNRGREGDSSLECG